MTYAPLLTFVHKALQRKDAVTADKIISVHTQHRITELDPVLTEAICRAAVNVVIRGQQVRGPRKVADFVGRGGARERSQFSPSAETEISGLCDDELQPSFFTY